MIDTQQNQHWKLKIIIFKLENQEYLIPSWKNKCLKGIVVNQSIPFIIIDEPEKEDTGRVGTGVAWIQDWLVYTEQRSGEKSSNSADKPSSLPPGSAWPAHGVDDEGRRRDPRIQGNVEDCQDQIHTQIHHWVTDHSSILCLF